jgi:hypothetical protein
MKLAEALILRADAQKRIAQLRERIQANAKVQEGEAPTENPEALFDQLNVTIGQFADLIKRINRTNALIRFDQKRTLTDALADRDALALQRTSLDAVIKGARVQDFRYGRSEIKSIITVNVADLQARLDNLSRQYRELDTAIQELNWTVEVVD